jgi:hypothetical protein
MTKISNTKRAHDNPGSDKPVHIGKVYCSPSCGGGAQWGCTVIAHDKAKRAVAALCLAIGGANSKWKPRVWENLGWHYCAISPCGRIKVHPGHATGYLAFLGEADSSGGRWVERARTPKAAIRKVIARGVSERAEIDNLLSELPLIGGRALATGAGRR